MTASFLLNVRAEFLKTRRTAALWLTIAGAGFIPLVNLIRVTARPDVFAPKMQADVWGVYINDSWSVGASLLLPFYVILVVSLVVQLEYGNNAWKQVYAQPRTYADIFFSKFLIIHFLIFVCFIMFSTFILLSAYVVSFISPRYPFLSQPVPWRLLIALVGKMHVSILAISAIQYVLSARIKNFVTPLGIGMACLIAGFMIRQWEHIRFYPYIYPLLVYFVNPAKPEAAMEAEVISVIWCVLVLLAGFWELLHRKEKG